VKAIQGNRGKRAVPIHVLRDWISKAADLVANEKRTDGSAELIPKARYKSISNRNIANMLGRQTFWLSECVAAQELILRKGEANEEVKRYLDPMTMDETPFGAKSFLDYLKTL
jgi:hypothetical protein